MVSYIHVPLRVYTQNHHKSTGCPPKHKPHNNKDREKESNYSSKLPPSFVYKSVFVKTHPKKVIKVLCVCGLCVSCCFTLLVSVKTNLIWLKPCCLLVLYYVIRSLFCLHLLLYTNNLTNTHTFLSYFKL